MTEPFVPSPETALAKGSPPEAGLLYARIEPEIVKLGYEIVAMELLQQPKKLQLFIESKAGITLDDCAKVSRAIDPLLEAAPELESIFHGNYELEVSSPGIERPLRKLSDFERFKGESVRIQTLRPISEEESGNPEYSKQNPRQKNFLGKLSGVKNQEIGLLISTSVQVKIPFSLVAKARLDPEIAPSKKGKE